MKKLKIRISLGLVNKEVYLLTKSIRSESFASINEKQEYEGFTIWDKGVEVGIIEDIELMPQQVIAWVNFNQKRVAIPLAGGLIHEVDTENKK